MPTCPPELRPRLTRSMPIVIALVLLATAIGVDGSPAVARKQMPSRAEQARFMWGLATRESNRDYYARNRSSGAFGKYQIMPFNWPAWSLKYLGTDRADQTPRNQERVAYGKLRDLYRWLGSWRRVAHWWLTGSSAKERRWSSLARGYVDDVMRLKKRAPKRGSPMPAATGSLSRRGDWRRSGGGQKLHLGPNGKAWPKRGRVRDGRIVRIRASKVVGGTRWLRVVTVDGRLGWVKQLRTVPARRPASAARWNDVTDRGKTKKPRDRARSDRRMVRPRPR